MFAIEAPILIVPTAEARQALGGTLRQAGAAAYREIALAAKGLEIAHLQFAFGKLTLAVCSRVRKDGLVEIEMGIGDPRLPRSTIHRRADARGKGRGPCAGRFDAPPPGRVVGWAKRRSRVPMRRGWIEPRRRRRENRVGAMRARATLPIPAFETITGSPIRAMYGAM